MIIKLEAAQMANGRCFRQIRRDRHPERARAIYLLLVARLLNGSHAAVAHFDIKSALALIREINYCFNYLPEDTLARPRASVPFAARGVCGWASSLSALRVCGKIQTNSQCKFASLPSLNFNALPAGSLCVELCKICP